MCTSCTACSGVACGNSIVIFCIVSPPWPPQGPSDTYQQSYLVVTRDGMFVPQYHGLYIYVHICTYVIYII